MGVPPLSSDHLFSQLFMLPIFELNPRFDSMAEDKALDIYLVNRFLEAPSLESMKSILKQNEKFNLTTPGEQGWTVLARAMDIKNIPLIQFILDLDPELINKSFKLSRPGRELGVKTYLRYAADISSEIFHLFLNRGPTDCKASDNRRGYLQKLSSSAICALDKFSNEVQLKIVIDLHFWASKHPTGFSGKPPNLSGSVINLCERERRMQQAALGKIQGSSSQNIPCLSKLHPSPSQLLPALLRSRLP